MRYFAVFRRDTPGFFMKCRLKDDEISSKFRRILSFLWWAGVPLCKISALFNACGVLPLGLI